ncbi:MAG: hypothetical protein LBD35_05270, partial [Prevotellaceae bacterium]|nr:hypothetical protein [Prevotellaceae bacterium]
MSRKEERGGSLTAMLAITLLLCFVPELHARIPDSDSAARVRSDSAVYDRMERALSSKKISRRIFSMLTRRPPSESPVEEKSIDEAFAPYRNMIIRNINVKVLPPFGYDVRSDSAPQLNLLRRAGNNSHINTRNVIIRNNLMFKCGERLDPLVAAASEAFLRRLEYVNDVYIRVDSLAGGEADVTVVVRDNWSIGGSLLDLSSKIDFDVFDRNFLGLGNSIALRGIFNLKNGGRGFGAEYGYSNFMKTFINVSASHTDNIASKNTGFSIERPLQKNLDFFGQISCRQSSVNLKYVAWDSVSPTFNSDFSATVGFAIRPPKHGSAYVLSARIFERNPEYRQVPRPDNSQIFQHVRNKMALVQLSMFRQRYFREQMLNNFGKTENFAYGHNVSIQAGFSRWSQFAITGLYASLKASFNRKLKAGSIFAEGAISSFFDRDGRLYEGVLKFRTEMFSKLYSAGTFSIRNFLSIDYTKRLSPVAGFRNYYLSFGELASMKIRSREAEPPATKRLMLKAETDVFSSFAILGFRFLFYAFCDLGWTAANRENLLNSRNLYWGGGAGIRIRNDLLVIRTLELKAGFYPRLNQSGFNNFVNFNSSVP